MRRERRWSGLVALAVALCLMAAACTGGDSHPARPGTPPASTRAANAGGGDTVLESSAAPWRLPAPLSRAVALPDGHGEALLLGVLDRSQATTGQILRLDLAGGIATPAGRLAAPVHDAAGALLGGSAYVFGGGAQQSVADVQAVVAGRPGLLAGRLPAPRSDLAAVTVAGSAYLVGGYDGRAPSRSVLQTADGRQFRSVAQLPQGVRYPALAADGMVLYVFGGESAGASSRAPSRRSTSARAPPGSLASSLRGWRMPPRSGSEGGSTLPAADRADERPTRSGGSTHPAAG